MAPSDLTIRSIGHQQVQPRWSSTKGVFYTLQLTADPTQPFTDQAHEMSRCTLRFVLPLLAVLGLIGSTTSRATEDFPIVPEDLAVALYAKEPLVQNPCAIAFDAKGRLCVGMGPQYRNPKPET